MSGASDRGANIFSQRIFRLGMVFLKYLKLLAI